MIISLLQEKGGVGKTTIAINLAYQLHISQEGKVLLVDSDVQGSARDWHEANGGNRLPVIGFDRLTIDKDIKPLQYRYSYIVIDGSPRVSEMSIKIIKCSDIVLIPVQPSPYDVWASRSIVSLIKERQDITDGLPKAAFVISRQIVNTKIGKEVRDALKEYDIPVLNAGTCQRVVYSETATSGLTILDSYDEQAKNEIRAITKEVIDFATPSGVENHA